MYDTPKENILNEPTFSHEIDGKYARFVFEDELFNYADGIMMRLMTKDDPDEKGSAFEIIIYGILV